MSGGLHSAGHGRLTGSAGRLLMPFVGLFILLIMFAAGGMIVIAGEADRSDAARARRSVSMSFAAVRAQLDAAVRMNAQTTTIANFLVDDTARPESAYDYFGFTHQASLGYYGTIVLNHDGTAFAGTRAGDPWTGPSLAAAALFVAPVAARLPIYGEATVSELRRNIRGELIDIAVTNVVLGHDRTASTHPGSFPRRLAMLSPVAAQLLPKMLPTLGVNDFHIGRPASHESSLLIPVVGGSPLAFAWAPSSPGRNAINRWAPTIAALLLAALALLAFAMRSSLAIARQLEWLAQHDPLTALPNRSAFRFELDKRLSFDRTIAVGMSDLNGFKLINDSYGHPTGDELLRSVAAAYQSVAAEGDFVARLGGDEFAWISPSFTAAKRFENALQQRLLQPIAAGEVDVRIGVAIGIVVATNAGNASQLMKLADQELYRFKLPLTPKYS